jgi:hypothetical protein
MSNQQTSEQWKKRKDKMKHSERMEELREKAEDIKGGIDTLIKCTEGSNLKQIAYWVGKLSRDVVTFSQACMGDEMIKRIKEKGEKGNIITP